MTSKFVRLIIALGVLCGAAHAQTGQSVIHGAGDPRSTNPVPDCTFTKMYVDDTTGTIYSASGYPCVWAPSSGGSGLPVANPTFTGTLSGPTVTGNIITTIPAGSVCVFEGDSRMASNANGGYTTAIPYYLATMSQFSGCSVINVSAGGSTMAQVTSRYAANVYPNRPAANGGHKAYLFLIDGYNDMNTGGLTPAGTVSAIQTYMTAAHADGFTTVMISDPPYISSPTMLANRIIELGLLKAAISSFDLYIDLDAIDINVYDLTLYNGDSLHPKTAGNLLFAQYINGQFGGQGISNRFTPFAGYVANSSYANGDLVAQRQGTLGGTIWLGNDGTMYLQRNPTYQYLFLYNSAFWVGTLSTGSGGVGDIGSVRAADSGRYFYGDDLACYTYRAPGAGNLITTPCDWSFTKKVAAARYTQSTNTVAFSATPVFDLSLGGTQTMTLTADVTSSTLSNVLAGQLVTFNIIQDGVGGHNFAWPTAVKNAPAIILPAGSSTVVNGVADGSGNVWLSSSVAISAPPAAPVVAYAPGDMACAMGSDTTIGAVAITGGSSTVSAITVTVASVPAYFYVGVPVVVTGATPSGYNVTSGAITSTTATTITYTSANNPAAWSSGGTIALACANATDAISGTSYTFANTYSLTGGTVSAGTTVNLTPQMAFFGSATAAAISLQLNYNGSASKLFQPSANWGVTNAAIGIGGSLSFDVVALSSSLFNTTLRSATIPTTSTLASTANFLKQPVAASTAATHTFIMLATFTSTGVVSGTYTSGGSITGTVGQTCTLTAFANSSTATATVALTGTNVIAGGTALVITSRGNGATGAPATATLGSGTATCSGTATIATVLGGAPGNAVYMTSFAQRQ